MDRGAWRATVLRVAESGMTEVTWHTFFILKSSFRFSYMMPVSLGVFEAPCVSYVHVTIKLH